VDIKHHEQGHRAMTAIFVVHPPGPPRFGRNRLAHFAEPLDRALVKAHHREFRIRRFRIEVEHIRHAGDKRAIPRGMHPIF